MKILIFIFIKVPRKIFRLIGNRLEYLHYRLFYSKPKNNFNYEQKRYLLYGGDDFGEIAKNYKAFFPEEVKEKIAQADQICDHVFDLLGSGPTKLSADGEGYQSIDWHRDFKSGYRWNPNTFYRNIRYGHIKGVDVKVPWELSRFQHLNILGQVYALTKDQKYADEFENQINDWIDNNAIGFGVNWRCVMDIAIRAANWLVAQEYYSDKGVLSEEFWRKFYKTIYNHGRFIKTHLENQGKVTTNHYISDLVGLFFISVYCPFFEESKDWQNFALSELSKEIEKQVYPDGCSFEASTCYHRLVLELLFYAELLGQRANVEFLKHYKDKVRKMFEFSLYSIKPNGMIPQIGDNDNGRFLIFTKRLVLENKYLLSMASIYYKDSDFKLPRFVFDEESFWLFGAEGGRLYDDLLGRSEPLRSKAFEDAGWYIMRRDDDYCFISCGSNGQKERGGHAHNDKLSFELVIDGKSIIVDPGTYIYTPYPEFRNKFRATEYHNTVSINGIEQNDISLKDMFRLEKKVTIKDAVLKEDETQIVFQGEIQYSNLIHKRTITLDKEMGSWQITDSITTPKPVKVELKFHLSPNVYFKNDSIISKDTDQTISSMVVDDYKVEKEEYDYSPEYGVKMKSECLTSNINSNENNRVINAYIRRT